MEARFNPNNTPIPVSPLVMGRSGLVNGNVAARASVSKTRRIPSASKPSGRVEIQPCNCRHDAGAVSNSMEAARLRTSVTRCANSSGSAA